MREDDTSYVKVLTGHFIKDKLIKSRFKNKS